MTATRTIMTEEVKDQEVLEQDDEIVEDEEQETPEEEPAETDDSEGFEEEEEPDAYESEEDYLKQYKLPGSPKTLDEVLGTTVPELVRKLNEYQQRDATRSKELAPKEEAPKTKIFEKNLFGRQMSQLIESGGINKDYVDTYKHLAATFDSAMNNFIQDTIDVNSRLAREYQRLSDHVKGQSWQRFSRRFGDMVTRDQLDAIMEDMGYYDYDTAFRFFAANDPNLMRKALSRAQKDGERKGRKKQLGRFTTHPKRSKAESGKTIEFSKYTRSDGTLDPGKLAQLDEKDSTRIIEAFEKRGGRR